MILTIHSNDRDEIAMLAACRQSAAARWERTATMQEITINRHEVQESSEPVRDPSRTIIELAGAFCLPRCLHVVANLGVADALDETPVAAEDLAGETGANADALGRVLRLLADHSVFNVDGNLVSHTPASRLLRTDHPQSLRAFARHFGLPIYWDIHKALEHAVRTGEPAVTQVYPDGFWSYFSHHPEESQIFSDAMSAKAHSQIAGVLAAYDFSGFSTIGDIGGGTGHLLKAILDAVPAATGVLFELPHVIAEVEAIASARLTLQAGDFFKDDLPSCDAYLLMEIIHSWND
jgi:hypothetical protein